MRGGMMTGRSPLPDPYEGLGVSPGASQAEISRAFRRPAPASHPADAQAADRLRAVMAAHELLSDPARKAAHDRQAGHQVFSSARDARRPARAGPASQLHPLDPATAIPSLFPRAAAAVQ